MPSGPALEEPLAEETTHFSRPWKRAGSDLLVRAVRRMASDGSDPVVELQTNFGGGKTHSMLALYHLFSGTPAIDLPGIEPILKAAGVGR
jgi:hypothetical protein